MTILVVDDDADIRLIASVVLGEAGLNVVEACNGQQAMEAYCRQRPDLVLMDLILGEEDGVAVAEALRASGPGPAPVAFLTGAVRPEQLERVRAAAPVAILSKPFDPAGLVDAVSACLGEAR